MSTPPAGTTLIDPETIAYFYDEEADGFGEPASAAEAPRNPGLMVSAGVIGLGFLALAVSLLGSMPLAGAWTPFLLSFGLLSAGTIGYAWFAYKDTVPGIKHDGIMFGNTTHRGAIAWALGIALTGFYVVLYWWPEYLARAIALVEPLSLALSGQPANQWFLYGFLYTMAVVLFGFRMFMRYRHNRYHIIRTISVMFFQLVLAFVSCPIYSAP